MNRAPSQNYYSTPTALAAIVVVSAAGLAGCLSASETLIGGDARLAAAALVALLCFTTTVPVAIFERRGDEVRLTRTLWIAAALALALIATSRTSAGLATLALVSESILYLRRRQAIAMIAAIVIVFFSTRLTYLEPANAVIGMVSFLSSIAFVVAFSRVAVREHEARDKLSAYAKEIDELATTRERNRIAREIHDGLGHVLTAAHVQLEAARAVGCNSAAADASIERAQLLLRNGLDEVRRSVAVLRIRGETDQPLLSAISALAEECERSGLHVDVAIGGAPRVLPPSVEFALFRSAQEALTNARRHASASRVKVDVSYGASKGVALSISDDGVGAPAAHASGGGGFGLLGIRERVELVGGRMRVESAPGRGFAVHVEVPA